MTGDSSAGRAVADAAAHAAAPPVYRVALLSNAMHQDNYARAFAAHPRLRLCAVGDEPGQEPYVAARNQALAALYGVPYIEGLDAFFSVPSDVVSVGAQIERRARLATIAAGHRRRLWLDKPPGRDAGEATRVAAAVRDAGVDALVFSHVAAPWAVALREALVGGVVGDLLALHLDFHFAKGATRGLDRRRFPSGVGERQTWTYRDPDAATDPTESSHNVIAKRELAEVGWYPLALVHTLCRQPVRRVYATAGAYFFPEHRDLGLEDFATVTLTLDRGPVVTISTGRTGRSSHPGGRMAVRATGTRGTLALDGGQPALLLHGGAAQPPAVTVAAPRGAAQRSVAWGDATGSAALVDHFVACLDGTQAPLISAHDAVTLMRILDAAYESAARGSAVEVDGS